MNGLAAASALFPASPDAERIASLFWWMAGGALLVWAGVIVLAVYCARTDPDAQTERRNQVLIVGEGLSFPLSSWPSSSATAWRCFLRLSHARRKAVCESS